jgi:FtsH-binding integral membrane protein
VHAAAHDGLSFGPHRAYLVRTMNYANRSRPLSAPSQTLVSDALWKTYRWMAAGLGVTGLVAMGVASSEAALNLIIGNRLVFYVLLFAQLGLVMAFNSVAQRASTAVVAAMFFAYAALTGATMSVIFLIYTMSSIASVFFITAGAFAGLSLVGLVTKRDLGAIGRFAIFALIGLIIASLVNMFVASSGLDLAISAVGVLIFAALTAYDTQKLKELFASGEMNANMPLVGALTLYLDFINMFLFLLRLFGRRRD